MGSLGGCIVDAVREVEGLKPDSTSLGTDRPASRYAARTTRHVSALEVGAFGIRDIDAAALLHCELHAAAPSGQLALKPSEKGDGLLV